MDSLPCAAEKKNNTLTHSLLNRNKTDMKGELPPQASSGK